jgi:hypothetical protein
MRITVQIDDALLRAVRRLAKARCETLDGLIERSLRSLLAEVPKGSLPARKRHKLPVSRAGGGTLPGVDLNNTAGLLDRMEGL